MAFMHFSNICVKETTKIIEQLSFGPDLYTQEQIQQVTLVT